MPKPSNPRDERTRRLTPERTPSNVVRFPRPIDPTCYRHAAQTYLLRAKAYARTGDVAAAQSSILRARRYASYAGAEINPKAVRRLLRKANAKACAEHLANAERYAAAGNLPRTKMSAALARASLAAAVENGGRQRNLDRLEGFKVQAQLNAIRNNQRRAGGWARTG